MTYANCLKYAEEARKAGNEELALFWENRAKNKKRPVKLEVKEEPKEEVKEEVKEEPKKKKKKGDE